MKTCQVSDSISIVKCHISGIRYQASSDNMSSTSVRYQVSGIRCQVSVSDVKCQGSGINYKHISVRYQVSGIKCQVYTYQSQVINMSISCELNTGLQHYMSGNHPII